MENIKEIEDEVVKILEGQGILATLRASLRASVYCAIHEKQPPNEIIESSRKTRDFQNQELGTLALLIVRDLLDKVGFNKTLSVFDHEASCFKKDKEILDFFPLEIQNKLQWVINQPFLLGIINLVLQLNSQTLESSSSKDVRHNSSIDGNGLGLQQSTRQESANHHDQEDEKELFDNGEHSHEVFEKVGTGDVKYSDCKEVQDRKDDEDEEVTNFEMKQNDFSQDKNEKFNPQSHLAPETKMDETLEDSSDECFVEEELGSAPDDDSYLESSEGGTFLQTQSEYMNDTFKPPPPPSMATTPPSPSSSQSSVRQDGEETQHSRIHEPLDRFGYPRTTAVTSAEEPDEYDFEDSSNFQPTPDVTYKRPTKDGQVEEESGEVEEEQVEEDWELEVSLRISEASSADMDILYDVVEDIEESVGKDDADEGDYAPLQARSTLLSHTDMKDDVEGDYPPLAPLQARSNLLSHTDTKDDDEGDYPPLAPLQARSNLLTHTETKDDDEGDYPPLAPLQARSNLLSHTDTKDNDEGDYPPLAPLQARSNLLSPTDTKDDDEYDFEEEQIELMGNEQLNAPSPTLEALQNEVAHENDEGPDEAYDDEYEDDFDDDDDDGRSEGEELEDEDIIEVADEDDENGDYF